MDLLGLVNGSPSRPAAGEGTAPATGAKGGTGAFEALVSRHRPQRSAEDPDDVDTTDVGSAEAAGCSAASATAAWTTPEAVQAGATEVAAGVSPAAARGPETRPEAVTVSTIVAGMGVEAEAAAVSTIAPVTDAEPAVAAVSVTAAGADVNAAAATQLGATIQPAAGPNRAVMPEAAVTVPRPAGEPVATTAPASPTPPTGLQIQADPTGSVGRADAVVVAATPAAPARPVAPVTAGTQAAPTDATPDGNAEAVRPGVRAAEPAAQVGRHLTDESAPAPVPAADAGPAASRPATDQAATNATAAPRPQGHARGAADSATGPGSTTTDSVPDGTPGRTGSRNGGQGGIAQGDGAQAARTRPGAEPQRPASPAARRADRPASLPGQPDQAEALAPRPAASPPRAWTLPDLTELPLAADTGRGATVRRAGSLGLSGAESGGLTASAAGGAQPALPSGPGPAQALPMHAGGAATARAVAPQITAAIAADPGLGRIELRLDPPELGTVEISLEITDRSLRATLTAERPATGELLRRHGEVLLTQLQQAGFQGVDLQFSTGRDGARPGDMPRPDFSPEPAALPRAEPQEAPITLARRTSAGLDLRL